MGCSLETNVNVSTSGVVLNNKLYIGSNDHKVYEYDPATGQQKEVINIEKDQTYSSGIVLNNKVYFGIGNKVYEYDPATGQQKVVITAPNNINNFIIPVVVLNNKIYSCPNNSSEIYEYDPAIGQQSVFITTNKSITSIGPVLNNKFYFWDSSKNFYEYDLVAKQQKNIEFVVKDWIVSETVLNNKVYFGTRFNNNLYEYNPVTWQQKEVIIENDIITKIGLFLNNKFYFVAKNKVYECDQFELNESNNINIRDQIKKGLYLEYKKQNPNSKIKKIYNINLEELTLSDITIEQTQKNKSSNLEQNINDFCKDSNSTFINNSNIDQTQNTIACSKQLIETNTFQKMNGFSKSETTSSTDNWSANVNTKVTLKATGSAGITFIAEGKVEVGVEVGGGYTWGGTKTYTIANTSNSSDTEIKTTTNTTTITVPSQPVKVPAHSKISISVISWENNIKLILSYYQKVNGVISADFIDKDNNKSTIYISIKDAVLNLLENNILPSKIKINDDNSISFSYNIKTEKQIIMNQTQIGEDIPLKKISH
ncbi:hypothetical protein [Spiroplasma endosymbiont of Megaselia nigra]|uniref:hypothetical protein n=1 Tax=Spiroplasma endosymbiont of Megaselia nigra TaxID=2478537 RepID=UPI000F89B450|nr:hypothetical protein [Spiroplasma endosymbiont of Megaselia nigra]RUO85950.1 hypothetical protein D9R21_05875 [Spiroplasma endosymbiont of Megaselia nigra]